VYLLKPSLGGVGGDVTSLAGCRAFGGAARKGHTVIMPCQSGVRALKVTKHSLHWKWQITGIYGSPVIAKKRVYVANANSGQLSVFSLKHGHEKASIPVGSFTHFPSETLFGHTALVPTLDGITAISGS
jgi:hypothetical protein